MEASLAIVVAINEALKYKRENKEASTDDIIRHVMKSVEASGNAQMAAISAANKAIRYREKNPNLPDKEVMQKIVEETKHILSTIDVEEE